MARHSLTLLAAPFGLLCVIGCGGAGPLTVQTASSSPEAVRQLRTEAVDAVVGDYPALAYAARESAGTLDMVDQQFAIAPFGIAVSRQADALSAILTAALGASITDGTYIRVLSMWALEGSAVERPPPLPAVPTVDQVPQLADGVLRVGMEIQYPPMEFIEASGVQAGIDVDLIRAMGQTLGVQVELVNLPFDELLDQVEGGQIDVAMSSITITPARAARVSFIPYFRAGTGILVLRGNPLGIRVPRDLCGHRVAVQEGTVHVEMVTSISCD